MPDACWLGRIDTPLGAVEYVVTRKGLTRIWLPGERHDRFAELQSRFRLAPSSEPAPGLMREVDMQLRAYFAGRRTSFDLPLDLRGTPFQVSVWRAVAQVPHGRTKSYADIAARVGKPRAFRAVGMAQNANPVPIVVPCHRVVGKDGSLVGYGGGLDQKEWLLRHEGLKLDHGRLPR